MYKIGTYGYSTNTGIGIFNRRLQKILNVDSHFEIPHPSAPRSAPDIQNLYQSSNPPSNQQIQFYIDLFKPDVVIMVETPINLEAFEIFNKNKVKVVIVPMTDASKMKNLLPYKDYIYAIICSTNFCETQYKNKFKNVLRINYPINTEYFNPIKIPNPTHTFIHNQGNGGAHWRKGSDLVYKALKFIHTDCINKVTAIIRKQPTLHKMYYLPDDVSTIQQVTKDYEEQIELYKQGKIYLAPSRREGLGIPILEAMSCGLPVITTNYCPMNEWFDDTNFLVKPDKIDSWPNIDNKVATPDFTSLVNVMLYSTNLTDKELLIIKKRNREYILDNFSTETIIKQYMEL